MRKQIELQKELEDKGLAEEERENYESEIQAKNQEIQKNLRELQVKDQEIQEISTELENLKATIKLQSDQIENQRNEILRLAQQNVAKESHPSGAQFAQEMLAELRKEYDSRNQVLLAQIDTLKLGFDSQKDNYNKEHEAHMITKSELEKEKKEKRQIKSDLSKAKKGQHDALEHNKKIIQQNGKKRPKIIIHRKKSKKRGKKNSGKFR